MTSSAKVLRNVSKNKCRDTGLLWQWFQIPDNEVLLVSEKTASWIFYKIKPKFQTGITAVTKQKIDQSPKMPVTKQKGSPNEYIHSSTSFQPN